MYSQNFCSIIRGHQYPWPSRALTSVLHFSNPAAQQPSQMRLCLGVFITAVNRNISAEGKRRMYRLQSISLLLGMGIQLGEDTKLQYQKVSVIVTVKPDVEAMSKARPMWRSMTRTGPKIPNIWSGKTHIRLWATSGACGDAWRQWLEDDIGGKRARGDWWKCLQMSQVWSNKTLLVFMCRWCPWHEIRWHEV